MALGIQGIGGLGGLGGAPRSNGVGGLPPLGGGAAMQGAPSTMQGIPSLSARVNPNTGRVFTPRIAPPTSGPGGLSQLNQAINFGKVGAGISGNSELAGGLGLAGGALSFGNSLSNIAQGKGTPEDYINAARSGYQLGTSTGLIGGGVGGSGLTAAEMGALSSQAASGLAGAGELALAGEGAAGAAGASAGAAGASGAGAGASSAAAGLGPLGLALMVMAFSDAVASGPDISAKEALEARDKILPSISKEEMMSNLNSKVASMGGDSGNWRVSGSMAPFDQTATELAAEFPGLDKGDIYKALASYSPGVQMQYLPSSPEEALAQKNWRLSGSVAGQQAGMAAPTPVAAAMRRGRFG